VPLYEYRCENCRHISTFLVRSWSSAAASTCRRCGGAKLARLISRFAFHRSWGESLDWTPGGETLSDMDEDDPKSVDRFMGHLRREMGGQVSPEFDRMQEELLEGPEASDPDWDDGV
jgi:putative FmdB family regulatory protein